jgi:DNA-binding CsgD family transcriptional regulator
VHSLSSVQGSGFPRQVTEALGDLIPCLDVVYFDRSSDHDVFLKAGALDFPPAVLEAMWAYGPQRPTAPLWLTPAEGAVKLSDRIGRRELLRLDFYQEVMRPLGIQDDLVVLLAVETHATAGFSFTRGEPFTKRDLLILDLLAPHLARMRARLATARPSRPGVDLTRREWDVMDCLAQGKGNKEIASLLGVTSGTVRKHLEHVFTKLGVHTRTAAVARAFRSSAD